MSQGNLFEIGIDTFVPTTAAEDGVANARRITELLEQIELADQVGISSFGIGEHHRPDFLASSPAILMAAAAARTRRIRLGSAVTVLSSDDPVRLFQQFAMVDLISNGRAEMIVGRGSFTESYPLFGFDLDHYDELFAEKLDLLLKIRDQPQVTWAGKHRPPLAGQGVYPRPVQKKLPIKIGVGGTPQSFARAGRLGLPLVVAIIGGEPHRFKPLIDLYRINGLRAGHKAEDLPVSIHSVGFVGETTEQAAADIWPAYNDTFSRIGKERGWSPLTRPQFDALRGPTGALVIGDPETVARKLVYEHQALGGIAGMSLLLGGGVVEHRSMMRTIELLGTRVLPMVRKELQAVAPSPDPIPATV